MAPTTAELIPEARHSNAHAAAATTVAAVAAAAEDQASTSTSTASLSESSSPTGSVDSESPIERVQEVLEVAGEQPSQLPLAVPSAQRSEALEKPQPMDDELAQGLAVAVASMATLASGDGHMSCFHSVQMPNISIYDYMSRIFTFFNCSGSCYVAALVYLDRVNKRQAEVTVSKLSSHRLLVTSVMVAAKFYDDTFYSNAYYAFLGGLTTKEINSLEASFLKLLNWSLHIYPEEFKVYTDICRACALSVDSSSIRASLFAGAV